MINIDNYPWIDFANKTMSQFARIYFDRFKDETRASVQVVKMLHPHLFRIPKMSHLTLQIRPQLGRITLNERKRGVVGTAKITCLVERHRSTDVHVAGVDEERPARWTLDVQHG